MARPLLTKLVYMQSSDNPYLPPGSQNVSTDTIQSWLSTGQIVRLAIYCLIFATLMEMALLVVTSGIIGGIVSLLNLNGFINRNQQAILVLTVATLVTLRITWSVYKVEVARLHRSDPDNDSNQTCKPV